MKKVLLSAIVLCCALLLNVSAIAQEQHPMATLTFMSSSGNGDYVDMEQEIWKPVHAQRVRDGKIMGWYLYQVASPYNSKRGYDYVTVEVYPNFDALEMPYAEAEKIFQEVHGSADLEEMMERTEAARKLVKQEYWSRAMGITSDNNTTENRKYIVLDWMDVHPGEWGDYMSLERNYFMPLHQKRVDAGNILSWALFTKMGYSESPGSIDAVTTAGYASWSDMWNSYPENAWEDANEGVEESAIYERIRETRTMVGSTVWRLIDYVEVED